MTGITGTRKRVRGEREQGAALVEFTLVAFLLLTLVFGIVEFGLAFRDRLTIGNASQGAARVGTAMGRDLTADLAVLQALEQTLSTLPGSGVGIVAYVDVFEANNLGLPTGGCPTGQCNRYFYAYIDGPGPLCDWAPCPDPDAGYSGWNWSPADREVAVGNLDVMGVEITFGHEWVIGSLVPLPDVSCDNAATPTDCWADTALMRMEPQQFGVGP
jgi:hypothetical protein